MCLIKIDNFIKAMRDGDIHFSSLYKEYKVKEVKRDIQYIDDNDFNHRLDIFLPEENHKVIIFNIHGGGYCYGYKEQSNVYCSYFANRGFEVVSMNYTLMNKDKEMSIETQITEVISSIYFVIKNKEKLSLKFEKIVLMGDSAGGHIAMMVALALRNPKLRNQYGNFKENINIDKLILSSPMYDYSRIVSIAKIALNKNGLMTLFSKNYKNKRLLKRNSPKYYLDLGFVIPESLLIYSKKDVFSFQSKELIRDFKKNKRTIDIYFEKDKKCNHVFHHFALDKETSIRTNEYIIKFILN